MLDDDRDSGWIGRRIDLAADSDATSIDDRLGCRLGRDFDDYCIR